MAENKEAIQTPEETWDEYKADMVKEDEKRNKKVLMKVLKEVAVTTIITLVSIGMYALAIVFVAPIFENARMYGINDIADIISAASGLTMMTVVYLAVKKMILWIWEE